MVITGQRLPPPCPVQYELEASSYDVLAPPTRNVLAPPCEVTRLWEETKGTVVVQRPTYSAVIALQIILSAFMYVCSCLNPITLPSYAFTATKTATMVATITAMAVLVAVGCHFDYPEFLMMRIQILGFMRSCSTFLFDIYNSVLVFVADNFEYHMMVSFVVVCVIQHQFIKWFLSKNYTWGLIIILMLQNIILLNIWFNKPECW